MSIFNKHKNKVQKFAEVAEGRDKEGVREAEEHLLKPEDIPKYSGKEPKKRSELASRTALIVFKNKAQQDIISEIFSVRESVNHEIYITDISLLEAIAKGVKEGKYQVVGNEIQLVTGPKIGKHWHENEEGTIRIHLPDDPFEPLTYGQEQSLKKKKRRKYNRIVDKQDVEAMNKFRAKHFPPVKATRMRRKI